MGCRRVSGFGGGGGGSVAFGGESAELWEPSEGFVGVGALSARERHEARRSGSYDLGASKAVGGDG